MIKNSNILFPAEEVYADTFSDMFQDVVSERNWVDSTSGIYTADEKEYLMYGFDDDMEELEERFILRPLTDEELGYNASKHAGRGPWPGFGLANHLWW